MAKRAAQKYTNSKAHEAKEAIPIEQILLQNKQKNIQQQMTECIQLTYDKSKAKIGLADIEKRKLIRAKTRETLKIKIKPSSKKLM